MSCVFRDRITYKKISDTSDSGFYLDLLQNGVVNLEQQITGKACYYLFLIKATY